MSTILQRRKTCLIIKHEKQLHQLSKLSNYNAIPTLNEILVNSKVKTLHRAIEYIQMLQDMLSKADEELGSDELCLGSVGTDSLNKENELHQRWLQLPTSWTEDNQNSCLSFYDDFGDGI
ncbi:UNVERIFIED_CONTAM: hypothetical protein NCL1_07676 [Trichonephila clavipes]